MRGRYAGILDAPRARAAALALAAGFLLLVTDAPARTAYVANEGSDNVSVIETATNSIVPPAISVGSEPDSVAFNPDGSRAYVTNGFPDNDVSVIDTASRVVAGDQVNAGTTPVAIAITPDGTRAYVANLDSDDVTVFDTATNTQAGPAIPVGGEARALAITPDGSRVYVATDPAGATDPVRVIDTATNTAGTAIPTGNNPFSLAITPDGSRVYVVNQLSGNVRVIDTATNTAGATVTVGTAPRAIAITPDGTRAYVANQDDTVSVIDTASNTVVGTPIAVGDLPSAVAITPDGTRAYVANAGAAGNSVSVIDTAANTAIATIPVGTSPLGIAITPNQPPVAAFAATAGSAGSATSFDASGSTDADGAVLRYDWDFGDGATLADGGPNPTHVYAAAGSYTTTLTVTDAEGCSTQRVFTGQTLSCNGSAVARTTRTVDVVDATNPEFALAGRRKQPLGSTVEVIVRKASEDVTVRATGALNVPAGKGAKSPQKRFKLGRARATITAGGRAKLKLRIPRKARRAAADALGAGRKVTATVSVTAKDSAGNATTRKRRVTLVG